MNARHESGQGPRRDEAPVRRRLQLGIVAACLLLALQSCAEPTAVESGVYVADLLGGPPQTLGAPAGAPVWAPTGDVVAWASEDGLFLRDISEPEAERLSTRVAAGEPAWSPDGDAIAIIDREAETLVALDIETGAIRFEIDVATREAQDRPLALPILGAPAWSPDGTRLAFNCWDGHGDEICIAGADGSGFRQVTYIQTRRTPSDPPPEALVLAVANAGPPTWSPDGGELALAVYPEQRGAAAGIYVVDLEAGVARRVSTLLPNSKLAWFADGQSLLFSARDQGRSDVFRVPSSAGEAERLTAALHAGAREPTLSPDQTQLAVVSNGDLVLLSIDGLVESTLDGPYERRLPAWNPVGDQIAFAAAPNPLASFP